MLQCITNKIKVDTEKQIICFGLFAQCALHVCVCVCVKHLCQQKHLLQNKIYYFLYALILHIEVNLSDIIEYWVLKL